LPFFVQVLFTFFCGRGALVVRRAETWALPARGGGGGGGGASAAFLGCIIARLLKARTFYLYVAAPRAADWHPVLGWSQGGPSPGPRPPAWTSRETFSPAPQIGVGSGCRCDGQRHVGRSCAGCGVRSRSVARGGDCGGCTRSCNGAGAHSSNNGGSIRRNTCHAIEKTQSIRPRSSRSGIGGRAIAHGRGASCSCGTGCSSNGGGGSSSLRNAGYPGHGGTGGHAHALLRAARGQRGGDASTSSHRARRVPKRRTTGDPGSVAAGLAHPVHGEGRHGRTGLLQPRQVRNRFEQAV